MQIKGVGNPVVLSSNTYDTRGPGIGGGICLNLGHYSIFDISGV